jgi:gamma-glutamyltranspeptidase/glutathione hydrolase
MRHRQMGLLQTAFLAVLLCLNSLAKGIEETTYSGGVVAADHPAASQAGARILERGGNVVDAAVATSFALAVVRPASCGLGGGGFMLIWNSERREAVALDYRERAPAKAVRELFGAGADAGHAEPLSVRGGLACGIPGTVAGLCQAAESYGSLPLAELLQPAIDLCEQGVTVDAHDMEVQATVLKKIRGIPGYEQRFALLLRDYLNNGRPWQPGDRFHSPLGAVLRRIAATGAGGFYDGPVGQAIAEAVRNEGGVLTVADLQSYRPTVRQPLTATFHGRTLLTMPPPSSGGIALLQTLQTLEHWEQSSGRTLQMLQHNSGEYVHVVTEALKHAFADRAEFLGDADYVEVPIPRLLSTQYAAATAARIELTRTQPAESYGRFFLKDDAGTSHFSVMDSRGNAVACTETINLTFGSFVVVPEYGIVLNNEMDDFAADPGKPNAFGLMQSESNSIAPGKRPLSSMTPVVVLDGDRAMLSAGASGGPRIITATLQNLLNQMVFGMTPDAAVTAGRFHHQWSPNELLLEATLHEQLSAPLSDRGHVISKASSLAATQGTAAIGNVLRGGSDPRKSGRPAGTQAGASQ